MTLTIPRWVLKCAAYTFVTGAGISLGIWALAIPWFDASWRETVGVLSVGAGSIAWNAMWKTLP